MSSLNALPEFFSKGYAFFSTSLFSDAAARLVPGAVTLGRLKTAAIEAAARLIVWAEVVGGSGEEKRAAVLAGVGVWFDAVARPHLSGWKRYAAPVLYWVVVEVVDEVLDGLVAVVKRADELRTQPAV